MNELFRRLDTRSALDRELTPDRDDVNSLPARLWSKRIVFATVFLLVMTPIFAVAEFWPPAFYASGTVIIGNLEPADNSLSAAIQKLGDPADLASQLIIAKSPRMIRLALQRPGVLDAVQEECSQSTNLNPFSSSADCKELKLGSAKLFQHVSSRYSVQGEGRSRVISMGYWSQLPHVSFILANALLISYLEDQRAENAQAREGAASWVLQVRKTHSSDSEQVFYQNLYKKATDLEGERRNLPNPARLVSLAEFPTGPSSPRRLQLLAGGIMGAASLAALLTLLKKDNRIRLRPSRSLKDTGVRESCPASNEAENRHEGTDRSFLGACPSNRSERRARE